MQQSTHKLLWIVEWPQTERDTMASKGEASSGAQGIRNAQAEKCSSGGGWKKEKGEKEVGKGLGRLGTILGWAAG